MGGLSLGELMMLNTGESPNVAAESRLSQILEDNPQEKYYLSAKACRGLLNRASRRGKDLPEPLREALMVQEKLLSACKGTESTEQIPPVAMGVVGGRM